VDTLWQRSTGGGNSWGGMDIDVSGNNAIITIQGKAGDTVDWKTYTSHDKFIAIP
jgi:hypothetical protein